MNDAPMSSDANQSQQKEQAFDGRQARRYTTDSFKPASGAATAPDDAQAHQMRTPHVYHQASDEGKWRRRIKFAVFALAVIIIGVILFVVLGSQIDINPLGTEKAKKKSTEKKSSVYISVEINATGYDPHNATPIPLLAVSTDADSTARIVSYYDEAGSHLKLKSGSYDITIPASPIGQDGTMFDVKDQVAHVDIVDSSTSANDKAKDSTAAKDSSAAAGSIADSVNNSADSPIVYAEGTLTLLEISDSSQITDDIIENAQAYALELGVDEQTVNTLVERVIQTKRDASATTAAIEAHADVAKNFFTEESTDRYVVDGADTITLFPEHYARANTFLACLRAQT